MTTPRTSTRLTRFLLVGAAGFVVQLVTISVLTDLGVHYLVSTAVAVEAAILCNFMLHERWTWMERRVDRPSARLARLWRFNLLTALTSIVGTVAATAALVEGAGMSPLAANAVAVSGLGLINFAAADAVVFRTTVAVAMLALATDADAARLQPKTAGEFARHAAAVEARLARESQSQMVPKPDADGKAIEVPGGIINHWRGTIFIPNVRLETLLQKLKNPGNELLRQEDVVRARVLSRRGNDQLTMYLRLKRAGLVTVVYDTEHDVRFRMVGPGRAISSSVATRIVEVERAGTPGEHCLPVGDDSGFLWRLNSYWRYEQTDGGVMVELESLTLSRDIPSIVRPIAMPIIDRLARESMTRTLAALRDRF